MEGWYRRFLLILSAVILVITAIELWLSGHVENVLQLLPSVMCLIGILTIIFFHLSPSVLSLRTLRASMFLMCLTSLVGLYKHFVHNLEFELEIRPNSLVSNVLWETITGASPMLAPGILFLAATLALAAVFRHPQAFD